MHSPIFCISLALLILLLDRSTQCFAVESDTASRDDVDAGAVLVQFNVQLSSGNPATFLLEVNPSWAPLGSERFLDLVDNHPEFWTGVRFFRVIEGFMAQFGIPAKPAVAEEWRERKISDDPVVESNTKGTISFATMGEDSRTTQMFINLVDNENLDGMKFSPFGKLVDGGMDVVNQIYSGYGEGAPSGKGPDQTRIQNEGNKYLKREFPKLSYITSVKRLLNDGNGEL